MSGEPIEISEEAMAELIKAMENPPKPSERLERAAKRYLEMVERRDIDSSDAGR